MVTEQAANQIGPTYKNDQSNFFVTVYFLTLKYNRFFPAEGHTVAGGGQYQ